MSGKKLSEPFLSPLLPLDPPHNFFNGMKQEANKSSVESPEEPEVSSLSSSLVTEEIGVNSTSPDSPSFDRNSSYVDLYSILLKIRQLKYETNLQLFLNDLELLSLNVKNILETYHTTQLLPQFTLHTSTSALVADEEISYKETILQSLSTILFHIHHLPKEKRDKLSNEFIQPNSSSSSMDVKFLQIWRRECTMSLTHLRELYFSKDYFHIQDFVKDSQDQPFVLPRSLPSWCNYLNSSCSQQQSQLLTQNSVESQANLMVNITLPLPSTPFCCYSHSHRRRMPSML